MSGIKGKTYRGALKDANSSREVDFEFVTVSPVNVNKMALDTIVMGFYEVSAAVVAEAGSTASTIQVTGHNVKKGDLIRLVTTSNDIVQQEIFVKRVIDADNFELDGVLTDTNGDAAVISTGDTFDVRRGTHPKYSSEGDLITTAESAIKIQIGSGGTYTVEDVTKDTTVPGNTIAVPVEIVSSSGAAINVTAGDIGVQLFHDSVTPDSVQVGDGTETLEITANGEALTQPAGNVADNAVDSGNPIKVGGVYNATPPTYGDGDRANLQVDENGNLKVADINVSTTPGTFAEDTAHTTADLGYHILSVRQDTLASSTSADGDYGSLKANSIGELYTADTTARATLSTIAGLDFATETTLSVVNGKLPTLGQKARAGSVAVTLSTEDQTILNNIETSVQLIDNAMSSIGTDSLDVDIVANSIGLATEATLSSINTAVADVATETTLSAISAKLPAALGQSNKTGSLSVTVASDQDPLPLNTGSVVDAEVSLATSITTSAYTELTASLAADVTGIQVMQKGGEPIWLAIGAAASEVDTLIIMPGGSPDNIVPIEIAAGSRVSLKAAGGNNISSVDIFINYIG